MPKLSLPFALIAIAAMTSVAAGDGVHLGGNGLRVDMAPIEPNATSSSQRATAKCNVRINRREVVLHWATTPFVHTSYPEIQSDAYLSATLTQKVGQLSVSPERAVDHTDVDNGDERAAVAMGIQGNGKLQIDLEVGINDDNAVAGKHCATVTLTVTGH
ncbi:MAG: hypothetical protein AB8B91_15760 [Rubripirellula sp.]